MTFVGPITTEVAKLKIPYVDVLKESERRVDLADKKLSAPVKKRRKRARD